MARLLLLDIPENAPIVAVAAAQDGVSMGSVGPYHAIEFAETLTIDRRATGCRHAVWYSAPAGLAGCRITQFDKDALRLEQR